MEIMMGEGEEWVKQGMGKIYDDGKWSNYYLI